MKHYLLLIFSIVFTLNLNAQITGYKYTRQNGMTTSTEDYVGNSPGNTAANSRLLARYKDSSWYEIHYNSVLFSKFPNTRNDGTPINILWTDATGSLRSSPVNYYTKAEADIKYLQLFNELDPVYLASSWFTTTNNSSNWDLTFGWGNHASAGYITANSSTAFTNKTGNISQWTNNSGYLTSITLGQVTTALTYTPVNPSGTAAQYIKGDGTFGTYSGSTGTVTSVTAGTGLSGGTFTTTGTVSMPNTGTAGAYGIVTTDAQGRVTAGKRQETYSGTTNASGVYTITYGTPYSVAPNVQFQVVGGTNKTTILITSSTTTGCSFKVEVRADVLGLLPSYSNVNGASVDALVTEK